MSDEIEPRFNPGSGSENPKQTGELFLKFVSGILEQSCDHNDRINAVNRLITAGWLERSIAVNDVVGVKLSPKGHKKATEFCELCMSRKASTVDKINSVNTFAKTEFDPPLTDKESEVFSALLLEYFIKFKWPKL